MEVNLPFLLCVALYLRAIEYKPLRGLYLEGWFNGWFFPFPVWGAYFWRGLYIEGLIHGILQYSFLFLDTFVLLFQNGVSVAQILAMGNKKNEVCSAWYFWLYKFLRKIEVLLTMNCIVLKHVTTPLILYIFLMILYQIIF